MIRNKTLLVFTSLLLFGATTFIDTRHYYLDVEDLIESIEVEREELKEGIEGRDWVKLSHGGPDFYVSNQSFHLHPSTCSHEQVPNQQNTFSSKREVPLFIRYCCLKVHLR